jgi:hypothetical protein
MKKTAWVLYTSNAFCRFWLPGEVGKWRPVSCKEYDQARASAGGEHYLNVYLTKRYEDIDTDLTVWIDKLDGKLVVAQVRNPRGCHHMRYDSR